MMMIAPTNSATAAARATARTIAEPRVIGRALPRPPARLTQCVGVREGGDDMNLVVVKVSNWPGLLDRPC